MKRAAESGVPALPTHVTSALGLIPVRIVKAAEGAQGEAAYGTYDTEHRVIEVVEGMSPLVQWQILRHEWIHSVLFDAGVQLTKDQEESVCTAVATALVAEMIARR